MEKEIVKAWNGKRTDKVPMWLMRQAGRYLPEYREVRAKAGGFLNMVYNPAIAKEITLQPLKRFDLDAAILFSDILVVPHALGLKLAFMEGEGPKLDVVTDATRLNENGFLDRLAPVMDTVAAVKADLPKGKALIGFVGSPWTVASYMVHGEGGHDFALIRNFAKLEPDAFQRIIDVLVRVTISYLDAQVRAGAEAVQVFESWASAVTGDDFKRWVVAPNAAIVAGFKKLHPHVPVIGFPRTAKTDDLLAFDIGCNAIGLSQDVAPEWAAKHLQTRVCVQGNLAPELLLEGGAKMEETAKNICLSLDGGPFVFNLGHGVIKETDPSHVAALVETVHGFKRRALAA
ncbi:MAG: uroporphyrinogen decarboxylase [Alphaproteobacteria bacterium]|nr:uroporphyrinogen decarboxylase [Alphaproteobacteria bacterium]